jgi:hypothetical protein
MSSCIIFLYFTTLLSFNWYPRQCSRNSDKTKGRTVRGSNPDRGKIFSSPKRPVWLWGPPSLLVNGYWGYFPGGGGGEKRRGHEFNHQLHPSSAEVNEWRYTSTPPIRVYGVERENFHLITFSPLAVMHIIL